MIYKMYNSMESLRKTDQFSRVGTKWTEEEKKQLIIELKNKLSISEIAERHKRTYNAIQCCIADIIYDMSLSGVSYEDLAIIFGLNIDIIKAYIFKKEDNIKKKEELKKEKEEQYAKIREEKNNKIREIAFNTLIDSSDTEIINSDNNSDSIEIIELLKEIKELLVSIKTEIVKKNDA